MFTKKAMYWDINNEIWELDCSCYSPKKNCNHKPGVLHGISATAVAGGGPVWLAVSTLHGQLWQQYETLTLMCALLTTFSHAH